LILKAYKLKPFVEAVRDHHKRLSKSIIEENSNCKHAKSVINKLEHHGGFGKVEEGKHHYGHSREVTVPKMEKAVSDLE